MCAVNPLSHTSGRTPWYPWNTSPLSRILSPAQQRPSSVPVCIKCANCASKILWKHRVGVDSRGIHHKHVNKRTNFLPHCRRMCRASNMLRPIDLYTVLIIYYNHHQSITGGAYAKEPNQRMISTACLQLPWHSEQIRA